MKCVCKCMRVWFPIGFLKLLLFKTNFKKGKRLSLAPSICLSLFVLITYHNSAPSYWNQLIKCLQLFHIGVL